MADRVRPQPHRLDPPVNAETLPQLITNADEMFQILFEDLAALSATVATLQAAASTSTSAASTAASSPVPGIYARDGEDGLSIIGPPGPTGPQGPAGADGAGGSGTPGPPGICGEDAEISWFVPPSTTPEPVAGCAAYQAGTSQTISTASFTAITFDTNSYDYRTPIHSTSVNTSRFTIPESGIYLLAATGLFGVSAVGQRIIAATKNGAAPAASSIIGGAFLAGNPGAVYTQAVVYTATVPLVAGDYIEFYAWQDTGGDLILYGTGAYYAVRGSVTKIG